MPSPDFHISHLDDGILRMKLPVTGFEAFRYPLHRIHDVQAFYEIRIDIIRIPDQAQHDLIISDRYMDPDTHFFQPSGQLFLLTRICIWFQYNDHDVTSMVCQTV